VHAFDERAQAATVGLDSARLAAALEHAATLPRLHNMIVARHGEVVVERHFRGPAPSAAANVKSASKSILSALIGIAVAEGHLEGLEQPVAPFFARHLTPELEPERAGITVRHLLAMRSGLQSTSGGNYGRWVTSSDWVAHAITRPMVAPPGEQMVYSTGSTHLLSAVLTQATGESTHAFAQSRLAEPLGIRLPTWPRDPQGIYFGGNDMLISPRALLRFGEMYRGGGVLDGRRILDEAWVRASWETVDRTDGVRRAPNRHQYGLGWWGRESNGYQVRFAWGYGGQFVFVVPALELTVVFTSDPWSPREGPHNQQLHRMLDELIVPAAMAGAEG
jgi:CubicO group peptidase (beta-lactamase class C family)